MDNPINQMYLFLVYLICGSIIGIFFDIFRILRKSFKTTDFITYIEDLIFGFITGIFVLFMIFIFNNGVLRFYIFLAIILGLILYFLTISKIFINISVNILVTIKKFIIKIFSLLFYPIKLIFKFIKQYFSKVILKPFRILIINIKGFYIKILKFLKKYKKLPKTKKDFR